MAETKEEIRMMREAYFAMKQVSYQRRLALVSIDDVLGDPSLSPEERLDKISKVIELSGMKQKEVEPT